MDHQGELPQHGVQPAGEMQPVNPSADVAPHVQVGEADLVPKVENENIMATGPATPVDSLHAQPIQSGAPQAQTHESIFAKLGHLLHHHTEEAVHEFKTNIAFTPLEIGANDTKTYDEEVKRSRGEKPHDHKAEQASPPPVTAVPEQSPVASPVGTPQSPIGEMPTPAQPTLIRPEVATQPPVSNPPFEPTMAPASNEAQNVVPLTPPSSAPASEPGVTQPAVQNPAA